MTTASSRYVKMGISCVDGYHNAQIFDVGTFRKLVDRFFTGTVTASAACRWTILEREILLRHKEAVESPVNELPSGSKFQYKKGVYHLYNPETIHLLQTAVRRRLCAL
ncbi:MAG: hypothetical protein R2881_05685 [Eubacteriales bacterium]